MDLFTYEYPSTTLANIEHFRYLRQREILLATWATMAYQAYLCSIKTRISSCRIVCSVLFLLLQIIRGPPL
jgi:hypothetical protein